MRRSPQTALELFQMAALFRRSAAGNKRLQDQEQLYLAAGLIEERARKMAIDERARPGSAASALFGLVDLTI